MRVLLRVLFALLACIALAAHADDAGRRRRSTCPRPAPAAWSS